VSNMSENISEELYRKIDQERINQAFENRNWNEAFILFKYSSLTKDEFIEFQQRHPNHVDKQLKEYSKDKDKERIEQALKAQQDEVAEYIFRTSELTDREFKEIKRRFILSENSNKVSTNEQKAYPNFWEHILKIISTKISKPSFDTWLKPTKGEIEGDNLNVFCDNAFQMEWLIERYNNLISLVSEEVLGRKYDIKFISEDKNE